LPTGVPRLDDVLGGGVPEYSFNVIAGDPGSGKTTLAHQVIFANATKQRPAIYFTILGEPALKMLRYQQQFTFFDKEQVNKAIHFINLSEQAMEADLTKVLESIVDHVQKLNPAIVVVDSFRTLVRATVEVKPGKMQLPEFVQRLAMHLTSLLHLRVALHKNRSACEAIVSIKPGAQAPGSDHEESHSP
jgi:circadian clock protein KaiC